MLKISCAITGDDYSMVNKDTPKSKKKIISMASTIFIPAFMWVANAFLLMYFVMDAGIPASIFTAIFFGVLIFLVERNIIMTKGAFPMIFRVLLGFVIAIIGAISMDEVIFKHDIDQQMMENKFTSIEIQKQKVDKTYEAEILRVQNIIDSKYKLWTEGLEIARKEADGTGGSGKKGVHAITKLKLQEAKEKEKDYNRSQKNLDDLKNEIKQEKENISKRINNNFEDSALMNRIKAMFDLIAKDPWMLRAYILFSAFLFFLEFIVVITKASWPTTNYERKIDMIEKIGERRMLQFSQDDMKNFDSGKIYPLYKNSKIKLAKAANSAMLF
jgi:hypothetical protein